MSDDSRERLRLMQAGLVNALVAGAPPPEGFSIECLGTARETLISKRARAAARLWPRLNRALEAEFGDLFAAYARAHPLPCDSAAADGRAFLKWLQFGGRELPDEARLEAFAFDARFRIHRGSIVVRRGPTLRAIRLRTRRRVVIYLRLPLMGERWLGTQ